MISAPDEVRRLYATLIAEQVGQSTPASRTEQDGDRSYEPLHTIGRLMSPLSKLTPHLGGFQEKTGTDALHPCRSPEPIAHLA